MSLCKYKDVLGKPNEGVHKLRDPIFGTAFWDVVMTIIASILIAYSTQYSFMLVLLCLFLIGIIMHRLFCVRTTVDKFLFPEYKK